MTQADLDRNEIIEMAREADLDWHKGWTLDDEQPNRFEIFAKLVAAKATAKAVEREREACAKVCEDLDAHRQCVTWYSQAIRARGETTLRGDKE